jgi:hemoglobin/transferrin/lactoferrin receptor protein
VSYAEGYRAPALTETLVTGAHPTGGGPGAFTCADGNPGFFCFVPNPNLRPEVGKNKEVGVNLKYDNVFQTGDAFRGKVNAFRNDLEDYIELTAYGAYNAMYGTYNFMQYQNVPDARIQGVEAELNYDAGTWFGGVSGHWIEGRNLTSNTPLATIPAARITSTLGARFWDRKLTTWVKWSAVTAQDDVPVTYNASNSYNLVNYYIGYEPTKDVLITFGVDNILDVYYIPWPTLKGSATDNTLDQQFAASAPGRVFKGSVFIRFGAL